MNKNDFKVLKKLSVYFPKNVKLHSVEEYLNVSRLKETLEIAHNYS